MPLSIAFGEAYQFDWGEEALVVGGIYNKKQVAHLKLCASRAFWLVAYPSQGHEMLLTRIPAALLPWAAYVSLELRITGNPRDHVRAAGSEYLFAAIDDHSPIPFSELYPDQTRASACLPACSSE